MLCLLVCLNSMTHMSVFELQTPESLKTANVPSKLMQTEGQIGDVKDDTDASAFMTTPTGPAKSLEQSKKRSIVCHFCGKTGHMKRQCFNWKRQQKTPHLQKLTDYKVFQKPVVVAISDFIQLEAC